MGASKMIYHYPEDPNKAHSVCPASLEVKSLTSLSNNAHHKGLNPIDRFSNEPSARCRKLCGYSIGGKSQHEREFSHIRASQPISSFLSPYVVNQPTSLSKASARSSERQHSALAGFLGPLRYDVEHGIVPFKEADLDQTSDASSHSSPNSSPKTDAPSLTSSGANIYPSTMLRTPHHLCRHWLEKRCGFGHKCFYVHGDLQYDPPAKNVLYPPPKSRSPCWRWSCGKCTSGYLCHLFHPDLDYLKPFPNTNTLSDRTFVATLDNEMNALEPKKYPPPKSNHFCKEWLLNQCLRGHECSNFHGDVEYDPPVEGINPPPPYREVCPLWLLEDCHRGHACNWLHPNLKYDELEESKPQALIKRDKRDSAHGDLERESSTGKTLQKHPRPPFSQTCQLWLRKTCKRAYDCDYVHGDLEYDEPALEAPSHTITKSSPIEYSINDPPIGQRPAPRFNETCIKWLRGWCEKRYACQFRHSDLDYDPPIPGSVQSKASKKNANSSKDSELCRPFFWTLRVHEYAKVKVGNGFTIQEFETGFETPWVYLRNVPAQATETEVMELLWPFGEVVEVKLPSHFTTPSMLVRARYSSPTEARQACTSLQGTEVLGCTITAQLPIYDASRKSATFEDNSIRIKWQLPSKIAYCGYSNMSHAKEAMQAAQKPFHDRFIQASLHAGLPVAGVVTLCLRGIPPEAKKEDMTWFAKPDDVIWKRPNYSDFHAATAGVKRLLQRQSGLLDFVVCPPPYRNGMAQAWAHFATSIEAKAACNNIDGRKPMFTGNTVIRIKHVQSLTLPVPSDIYVMVESDIQALCRTVYHSYRQTIMYVVDRPGSLQRLVKLNGNDVKELGQLKAEVEKIFNWETIRADAKFAWDPFFACPAGKSLIADLEHTTPSVMIRIDAPRRMISLRGSSKSRATVREQILNKIHELSSQQIRVIQVDGFLVPFMNRELSQVQDRVGRENVNLDFQARRLIVRGGDDNYNAAREAVDRVREAHLSPIRRRSPRVCPVCFNEATNPVTLQCTHTWCRECLTRYLVSSVSNKYFPLTCLGNDAKCTEHIPISIARDILTVSDFDAVVDAALLAHVQTRPDEFRYCPTPGCLQIYRHAPRDTILQCPSCLLRICPNCHVEAHEGFACPNQEADDALFREWSNGHDVKPCPSCKVMIERAEGCNHMLCTQCKTHICWVCLRTFPGGEGIYDHMRTVHGGIGLIED